MIINIYDRLKQFIFSFRIEFKLDFSESKILSKLTN